MNADNYHDIGTYVLYSTMEPCPLCFGAIMQNYIQHVKFATRDDYAGATALNNSIEYIKERKIRLDGPDIMLQALEIALIVYRRMEKGFIHNDAFFRCIISIVLSV